MLHGPRCIRSSLWGQDLSKPTLVAASTFHGWTRLGSVLVIVKRLISWDYGYRHHVWNQTIVFQWTHWADMVNHEIPCVCSTFHGLLIAMNPGQSGTKTYFRIKYTSKLFGCEMVVMQRLASSVFWRPSVLSPAWSAPRSLLSLTECKVAQDLFESILLVSEDSDKQSAPV